MILMINNVVTNGNFFKILNSRAIQIICLCVISMLICQIAKLIIFSVKEKKIAWSILHTTGGFPSSHSSMCMTLVTSMALFQIHDFGGIDLSFAVAVVFSIITIYDAMGIRLEASKHAKILNNLTSEMPLEEKKSIGFGKKGFLNELLGHKFFEVSGGILIGILIGVIGYFVLVSLI